MDIYCGMYKYDIMGVYIMGFWDSFLVDDIVNIEEFGIRNLELYDIVVLYF